MTRPKSAPHIDMSRSNYLHYKSCPFCGGRNSKQAKKIEARVNDFVPIAWVECSFCFAVGPKATCRADAIRKWNDRPYFRGPKPLSDDEETLIDEVIHEES